MSMSMRPTQGSVSTRDLARDNRGLALSTLVGGQTLSRMQIAELTGISPATMSRLTPSLLESGLLSEAGSDETTGGRPSVMFRFNPNSRMILAVDIDEHSLDVAEVNLVGEIRRRRTLPVASMSAEEKLAYLVETVASTVRDKAGEHPYVTVGVSVPSPVDADGKVMMAPALGWYDVELGRLLREQVEIPVVIENDVNLVAYAEYKLGDWGDIESLAAIGVYEGVGAGIVENGRLWRGRGGAAGQFGRMLADSSGLKPRGPAYGQMESRLGSAAIRARAIAAGLIAADSPSAEGVFLAAMEGDERALEFIDEIASEFATHLTNFCVVVAPDRVVFAGLFAKWADLMLPIIADLIEPALLQPPALAVASTGPDGKVIGAGLYAFEQVGGLESLV